MGGQRIDQWERLAMPCHEGHGWTQGCRFGFKLVHKDGVACEKGGRYIRAYGMHYCVYLFAAN